MEIHKKIQLKLFSITSHMFNSCGNIISIDLLNFDFSNINDMSYMFYGCSSLLSINISNIKAFSLTNMNYMFYGCGQLKSLDLSNWQIPLITQMDYRMLSIKVNRFLSFRCSIIKYFR